MTKTPKITAYLHYHKDGTIWVKGRLQGGMIQDYWEWYRKDGSKMRSGHFQRGKQVGEWVTYDKKGKIVKVTQLTQPTGMSSASSKKIKTVDDYIRIQSSGVRATMQTMRATIRKAVPGAEERMSYGMPGYRLEGPVVWFAAFKNHYSLFARPPFLKHFQKELKRYSGTKSAIHFPLGTPVPRALITKIAKYVARENTLASR